MENNKNQNKPQRAENGKFLPGNQFGKMPQKKLWSIEELGQAIIEVELEGDPYTGEKRDILKHFVREAFKDNRILAELIGKKIPKISVSELKSDGSVWNISITQFNPDSGLSEDLKKKMEDYRSQLIKEQGEGENQS